MDRRDYLQSALLDGEGFVHAFFTRRGGVSGGPFATLNLSLAVGDHPEHVTENLRQAARVLGLAASRVCVPRQVHGNSVLVLDGPDGALLEGTPADASVSLEPTLACAVRTADCVPILLADRESGRVAAVHAGWRGVVGKVVRATVERMQALGSRPAALLAAIGPHISAQAFEVGEEVAAQLAAASPRSDVVVRGPGQKPHVALAAILRAQLLELGLASDAIEELPGCTYGDAERFFSYRRDGQRSGRMLSAIVPAPRANWSVSATEQGEPKPAAPLRAPS
jgi:polyphenol oxidase